MTFEDKAKQKVEEISDEKIQRRRNGQRGAENLNI